MSPLIPFRTDLPPIATLHLPRCKPGSRVIYKGRERTVEQVILRGFDLYLKLQGMDEIHLDKVQAVIDIVPVHPREHRYWSKDRRAAGEGAT